ncbi:MAG: hypothetical protein LBV51_00075 [Acholeplasmatales bacterium]|jgi:hypothetical protein|nr:hypothetical protein [Acholeplasmatales bacterium]
MKNFDVNDFVDSMYYTDYFVYYEEKEYHFNGGMKNFDKDALGNYINPFNFRVYIVSEGEYLNDRYIQKRIVFENDVIFEIKRASGEECVQEFLKAKVWNGKTFFEVQEEFILCGG